MDRQKRSFGLLCSLAFVSGCAGASSEFTEEEVLSQDLASRPEVPAAFGNARWFDLGPIGTSPADTAPSSLFPRLVDDGASADAPGGRPLDENYAIYDDSLTGRRYALAFPKGFGAKFPSVSPGSGGSTADDELVQKGWSDNSSPADGVGDDNRKLRSTTVNPFYYSHGYLSSGCSGQLLSHWGPDANGRMRGWMITAAHCVYDTSSHLITGNFEPAAGNVASKGKWDITSAIIPGPPSDNWISNGCALQGETTSTTCAKWDIALVQVTGRAGTTWLSDLAFGTYTQAFIQSHVLQQAGYPSCSGTGKPAGCSTSAHELWVDLTAASAGNFRQADLNTTTDYRLFDHSSDINGGDSGGSMLVTDGSNSVLYGVNIAETCVGTCTNSAFQPRVNIARRITQSWYQIMFDTIRFCGPNC